MSTWEERMAVGNKARREAAARQALAHLARRGLPFSPAYGVFAQWLEPGDPEDINPMILAARCLGITNGDPGPRLPESDCRVCWGDRYVWYGNAWGLSHVDRQPADPLYRDGGSFHCAHACHEGEVLLASA